LPPGCAFAPRCPEKTGLCDAAMPALKSYAPQRMVRCVQHEDKV
jgi:ABC-type dipeptide/oligopeptide/nickel transport system ATPase component